MDDAEKLGNGNKPRKRYRLKSSGIKVRGAKRIKEVLGSESGDGGKGQFIEGYEGLKATDTNKDYVNQFEAHPITKEFLDDLNLLEYTTDGDPQFEVILERIKRNIDNIHYLPDFINKLAVAVLKYRMKELVDDSKTEHFEYILDLLVPELKKNKELEEKCFIQEINYIREYLSQDLKSSIVHFLYLIKDIDESSEYNSLDPIIKKGKLQEEIDAISKVFSHESIAEYLKGIDLGSILPFIKSITPGILEKLIGSSYQKFKYFFDVLSNG